MNIVRQIDVFDIHTEFLVIKLPLPSFDLDSSIGRFKANADNQLMYGVYKIPPEAVELFPSINFDFDKFSYFVGCYQA